LDRMGREPGNEFEGAGGGAGPAGRRQQVGMT
jgi:hypothetical protein